MSLEVYSDRQIIDVNVFFDRGIDARERPWYQAAVEAGELVWTEVYVSVSKSKDHALLINASQPLYDNNDQLQGVINIILDLEQISDILQAVEVSPFWVNSSLDCPQAYLYGFNLPDPIPVFPLHLIPGNSEPIINLQKLIGDIYDQSGYDLVIDYPQILYPLY